ncbi:MAG: hypothetical protein HC890_07415 [Chloroflexaceae bacterium]|nr:hypothetical protein [Chloroflexaceae bacterium]
MIGTCDLLQPSQCFMGDAGKASPAIIFTRRATLENWGGIDGENRSQGVNCPGDTFLFVLGSGGIC